MIEIVLLTFLAIVAVASIRMRDLFGIAMLFGIFSLLSASLFVALDAPDVAMTEAAVGTGVSTILMLSAIVTVGRRERTRPRRVGLPLLVTALVGAALFYGTLDMPHFGIADAPMHLHPIADHYIRIAPEETGIPNMLTPLLASYRGYDTLGETAVVFTAGIGVLALIASNRRRFDEEELRVDSLVGDLPAERHDLLRVVGKLLIPPILMYGCYVQAHGDFGPGGGFQAGVIFASGLILFALLYGAPRSYAVLSRRVLEILIALGLLLYGSVGVLNMLQGGKLLDYRTLAHDPHHGIHYGIFAIELGVGITVTAVMTTLSFVFARYLRRVMVRGA